MTKQQRHASFLSFDVLAEDRKELKELFKEITSRSRKMVSGVAKSRHQEDGPTTDLLTITLGVGASLFDDRFDLSAHRPRHLKAMPQFPNDRLTPSLCHGDLSLQICANYPDAVVHVVRDLARTTDGMLRPRWRRNAYINPSRPSGPGRVFLGFKDGLQNPDTGSSEEMDRLMWVTPPCGEPKWALGGCYQVVRLIRFDVEKWDQLPISDQEKIFGRHKSSGAPLSGTKESDTPDFSNDPHGEKIPLNAHIRLANPRTQETDNSRLYRRSYNFDNGFDEEGRMNLGLVFCAYQQDVERQFATVQRRLEDEPLSEFVTPFGGGYFYVLPGVEDEHDYLGRSLLRKR
ncbi:Dyp-type peroxidase [Streptomyces piniterrae]|uniref:Dyp-type peroxidase n=1 Tax=Streptomyces piniterrae TaxID=2571125 RepID=UPI001FEC7631|nr:Dyp-type peroxidase [Streptomyces piniterrae]